MLLLSEKHDINELMQREIFFHFGPGAHAEVEMNWPLPRPIEFWQQPYVKEGQSHYIVELVSAGNEYLKEQINQGHEIILYAHSFGAFLVNELPQDTLDQIKEVHFIAPTFNFFHSLSNLFEFAVDCEPSSYFISSPSSEETEKSQLRNWVDTLKKEPTVDHFWATFNALLGIYPEYLKLYFESSQDYEKYKGLADKAAPMDEKSLIQAVNELVQSYNKELKLKNYKKVTFHIGLKDPLISKRDRLQLEEIVGKQNIVSYDVGHFPHLESRGFTF